MMNSSIRHWFENLYFSEPVYFIFLNIIWALAAVLILILVIKLINRPPKSKYSRYRLFGKDAVWVAALMICTLSVVALAGPKINKGMKLIPGGSIDVGFIIDSSFSTKVDDIDGKTRLDVIKSVIAEFIDSKTMGTGDRVTLLVFGTHSFWRMPFSEDFNIFRSQIMEVSHPQVYWEDSQLNTNLANTIEYISKVIDKDSFFEKKAKMLGIPWFKNNRIVFLFSDGHDTESADLRLGIEELKKRKIKIYSVGIGTQGSKKIIIEAYDPKNPDKTVKETKKAAETKLEMRALNEIAAKTGGESYVIDSAASVRDAQNFLKNTVNSNRNFSPRLVASDESRDIWWEILAIPAIMLLLITIWRI